MDNLAENFALEKPSPLQLKELVQRHPVIAAGLASGTGLGVATLTSPVVLGAAVTGATLAGAYRAAPAALKGTGALLSAAGKATDLSRLSTNLDRLPLLRSAILYGNEEPNQEEDLLSMEVTK